MQQHQSAKIKSIHINISNSHQNNIPVTTNPIIILMIIYVPNYI